MNFVKTFSSSIERIPRCHLYFDKFDFFCFVLAWGQKVAKWRKLMKRNRSVLNPSPGCRVKRRAPESQESNVCVGPQCTTYAQEKGKNRGLAGLVHRACNS